MKKHSVPRLSAAILLLVVFLGELYLFSAVLNQYGTSSMAMGHLACLWGMFLTPVLALVLLLPVYENHQVQMAVTLMGITYAAACGILYQPAATLYATGLSSQSIAPGYYVVIAKAVLIVAAVLVATITPKAAVKADAPLPTAEHLPSAEETQPESEDCSELCSEELTDEQADSMKKDLSEEK